MPVTIYNRDRYQGIVYGQIECILRSIIHICGYEKAKNHLEDIIEISYGELNNLKKLNKIKKFERLKQELQDDEK